ncbi:hypothetical protein [Nocardioides convexus]|uniref:hypothetical protein n=1 Tax=Nocardioides convexus TaxID=2712224 RepID=UPI0024181A28|nr:hypothetical protein [Nocardioides convexus]
MSSPSVPQHCPTPRELDDLEPADLRGRGPDRRVQRAGQPDHPGPPREPGEPPRRGPRGRARRPRGPPPGPARPHSARAERHPADPRPVRRLPLPARAARRRPRAVRRTHRRPGHRPGDRHPGSSRLRGLGPVLLAALVGAGTPAVSPVGLLRATTRVAAMIGAEVVAIPLTDHGPEADEADAALRQSVLAWYAGADDLVEPGTRREHPARAWRASRPRSARPPPTRAWCSSSPACPAAGSPPSPAR